MSRKHLLALVFIGIVSMFFATGIYAKTKVFDQIRLENKAYSNHKEGIVIFHHRKHQKEYRNKNPELFRSQCGECHHAKVNDKKNKPLVNLKEGDDVKKCIECHKKAAYVRGKKAKGLSKIEKRQYHANAVHDNCKDCHKKFNKKKRLKSNDKGAAPNTCKTCHPKVKSKIVKK